MIISIIKKEWLKIRFIILTLFIVCIAVLFNFWYNLNFSFSTVEPESMMWYRYSILEQKPYGYLLYIYLLISSVIAIFQFIPERVKNRIKIMTHLPIPLSKALFLHLYIGIFFILLLSLIITVIIISIMYFYYPKEIIFVSIKDITFYFLCSIILYLGLSSAIIEKKAIFSAVKLCLTIFVIFIFQKTIFTSVDLVLILLTIVMFFVALDSFYSIKEQRLTNSLFMFSLVSSMAFISFVSYDLYKNNYKKEFNKYYIFYSPIINDFVYQKNFGDHSFEYGIKDKRTFDRQTYESYLPFVYWRNLDIQNKLPIKIANETFDKQTIKKSRLSFSYNPNLLKKQEVDIYPLINPISNIGMIKFPEEVFSLNSTGINIYNFDDGLDKELTDELKKILHINKVSFPIKSIWGKATNMKPFDLGYFFLDNSNNLYKLNRVDNKIFLKQIEYPKNIDINFMRISENRQQKLAGYAIDGTNSFYLIDYKTFEFKKLELKNFDYKKMKLQLISNPKYYLLRYSNKDIYHVVVFDKQFNKIKEETFQ